MIIKSFEINKIDNKINQLILFYGKNEGLKNEALSILIKDEIIFKTMKKKKF
jgi:DNA polymerase-3 subunit delta